MLVINRELGVANNVDEQDMRDLQRDLFLDLCGHGRRAPPALVSSSDYRPFLRQV